MKIAKAIDILKLTFWLLISPIFSKGNGVFPIKNFTSKEINAGKENWALATDKRGVLYIGNSHGLLEFDGYTWDFFPTLKQSPIRSLVISHDNRIYIGGLSEFGYYTTNSKNELQFYSLLHLLPKSFDQNFSDVWKVHEIGNLIYFISNEYVFVFDGKKIEIIEPQGLFHFGYVLDDTLFIIDNGFGLKKIKGKSVSAVKNSNYFANEKIYSLEKIDGENLLICTRKEVCIYNKSSGKITAFPDKNSSEILIKSQVYASIKLDNNTICYGTLLNGILIFDVTTSTCKIIHLNDGLPSNKVLSLHQDLQKNIWIGTDNGISLLKYNSNILTYNNSLSDNKEDINNILFLGNSLIYSTANEIYLGTTKNERLSFERIKTNLLQIEDIQILPYHGRPTLFICSANGTYILQEKQLIKISSIESISICSSKQSPSLYWVSSYLGLYLIDVDKPKLNRQITDVPIRKAIEYKDHLYLSTFNDGIFHGVQTKIINNTEELKPLLSNVDTTLNYSYPFIINNRILFSKIPGFLEINKRENKLVHSSLFHIPIDQTLRPLTVSKKNDIYCMSTDLEGKKSGCKLCWNGSSFSLEKSEMNYFDNMNIGAITVDSSDNIWIAADNKIFKYLTTKTHKRTSYICYIQRITSHYSQIVYQGTLGNSVKLNAADEILLDYTNNNLTFDFSTTNYFESNTMCYSYKLDGYDEDFSIYETKHQVSYTKLREGEYRFYVKAKNVYGDESNVATIKFTIKAPWYRTTVAYIVYIILIVLIIYLIVQLSIYRLKKTKERLESIVSERTNEISIEKDNVEKQKKLVELKNKDITDSISYAQRIQEAILPDIHEINKQIKNCFFLFQPRDIVSGDFYWYKKISDSEFLIACVDCTGHGVPGAFMSLIGNTLLNEIVNQKKIYSPELLLNELHLSVRTSLKQHSDNSTSRDGMDISIVKCNLLNRSIEYAGANRPLFIVTNKHELIEIKADKYPIGGLQDASKREFKLHHISCEARTRVYMTSDGFADQFGGPNSKKFMVKRFKEMLLESSAMNILDQKTKFTQIITNWRGELEQVDDILVIGFEI